MLKKKFDKNLLIVDDESSIRDGLVSSLEVIFKKVYVACDAFEAIELYKTYHDPIRNPIDLVISDINMPEINGLEMVKELRKINYDLHVIIISGFDLGPYKNQINEISD